MVNAPVRCHIDLQHSLHPLTRHTSCQSRGAACARRIRAADDDALDIGVVVDGGMVEVGPPWCGINVEICRSAGYGGTRYRNWKHIVLIKVDMVLSGRRKSIFGNKRRKVVLDRVDVSGIRDRKGADCAGVIRQALSKVACGTTPVAMAKCRDL